MNVKTSYGVLLLLLQDIIGEVGLVVWKYGIRPYWAELYFVAFLWGVVVHLQLFTEQQNFRLVQNLKRLQTKI